MKRYKHILIFWAISLSMAAQGIHERIGPLLDDALLTTTDASIAVYDLTDDTLLFSHRADKLCRPASTLKLVTAISALRHLGTEYTINTELRYTGTITPDSILCGNLYIVGGFDSEFTSADMDTLIAAIPKVGIRYITGHVFADVSMTDSVHWGQGWCWDDAPASFQAYYSPLMLEKGCVEVCVTPTKADSTATVVCLPHSTWYDVINHTTCYNDSAGPLRITRDWLHGKNTITITGSVAEPSTEKLSIYTSDTHFCALFNERLLRSGVGACAFSYGTCPDSSTLIAAIQRPISQVVGQALKESDNLSAEALFLHMPTRNKKAAISAYDASQQIDSLTRIISTDTRKLPHKIVDGSGLSHYNMVSAHLLLDYLCYAYSQPNIYQMLREALPHSGTDGTLKYRMVRKDMRGRIVAKTGSMTGVSTLAGYATKKNGHVLAFVIMNQNVVKLSQARTWQDKLCKVLCE